VRMLLDLFTHATNSELPLPATYCTWYRRGELQVHSSFLPRLLSQLLYREEEPVQKAVVSRVEEVEIRGWCFQRTWNWRGTGQDGAVQRRSLETFSFSGWPYVQGKNGQQDLWTDNMPSVAGRFRRSEQLGLAFSWDTRKDNT
jgi:hypothetical protein